MPHIVARGNAYSKFYNKQLGGNVDLPVFVGGQHGAGIGNVLHNVLRNFTPTNAHNFANYASSALRGQNVKGTSLKEVALALSRPMRSTAQKQTGTGNLMSLYRDRRHRYARLSGEDLPNQRVALGTARLTPASTNSTTHEDDIISSQRIAAGKLNDEKRTNSKTSSKKVKHNF